MFDAAPDRERTAPAETPPAPDRGLQDFAKLRHYVRSGKIPWRKLSSWKREDLCNSALVSPEDVGYRNQIPFPLRSHRFTHARGFQDSVRGRFLPEIRNASIHALKETRPDYSAAGTFSFVQKLLLAAFVFSFVIALARFPLATIVSANIFITAYFLMSIGYRFVLMIYGWKPLAPNDGAALSDDELPVITILLPLYRDADALASLWASMEALDYPKTKLDFKLLLEEDDHETLIEATRLGLDQHFEVIIIPEGGPQTKPKACNYGMHLARGDLIVIFDAEDQPEPDQLRKAASAFHRADAKVACIQARLNYYNANENWLTRLFTLEYSLWFDWLLPALQRFKAPIPLGGTSNYFRTDTLLSIGGWDPFNVTEDADLGLRLSKLGYRVEILDSTTFEEANCKTGNWVRQRSRWMKGYIQTWLVHMRRPGDIIKTTGWSGFLSVQLFIAGNVFSGLINPVLWAVFILWAVTQSPVISEAFPGPLLWLNIFALTIGNLFFILLAVVAPMKRGWHHLSLSGFTAPFYWLLTSLAAYKAVWQLIFRPHYWEKTDHVISEHAIAKRDEAMRAIVKNRDWPEGD